MFDTIATWEVLEKQIEKYNLDSDVNRLADLSRAGNHKIVDMAGRIAINTKGVMDRVKKDLQKRLRKVSMKFHLNCLIIMSIYEIIRIYAQNLARMQCQ